MALLNLKKKRDCSQSTRVEREKRDRRDRGGDGKEENRKGAIALSHSWLCFQIDRASFQQENKRQLGTGQREKQPE